MMDQEMTERSPVNSQRSWLIHVGTEKNHWGGEQTPSERQREAEGKRKASEIILGEI